MSGRKTSQRKQIKSNDASIGDIKKLQSLVLEVRRRPKGMKTSPKFKEIEEILRNIERDYQIVAEGEIGKFRLKEKKIQQILSKNYVLTTIIATPEEVFKEEGKIVKKIIPENLEFIITIKTFLKDKKKKIKVSINKPETSNVDLGKKIEIICGTSIPAISEITKSKEESKKIYKQLKQMTEGKPGIVEPRIEQQRKLIGEMREAIGERKVISEIYSNLDPKIGQIKINYQNGIISLDEFISQVESLIEKFNILLKEKNIKNKMFIFNNKTYEIEIKKIEGELNAQ